jgi:DNA-binding transcriptional LysR family regulator
MYVIYKMNNQAFDMRLLQCFETLMTERSVTRAAERMAMSQPAMSHALARLRRMFDDPLLLKGHGQMTATNRAIEIEAQVSEMLAAAQRLTRKPAAFVPATARIKFAIMTPEFVEYLLAPRLIQRLQQVAPGIDIEFRTSDPRPSLDWLERGEIDFRLGWWPEPPQTLRFKLLFRDPLVCLARKGHPQIHGGITTEQYLQTPHVRIQQPRTRVSAHVIDQAVHLLRRKLRIALQVQNALALSSAVADSNLIATVPKRLALALADKFPLQVLPLPLNVPDVRIAVYWHERTHRQAAHRWFRQVLTDCVKLL